MCLPLKPYKIERQWEFAGLTCVVVLAREAAHRCGYVRVPPNHPLHGKDYDTPEVEVHGGLTFAESEPCAHDDGIGWWFGFDCAHFMDASYDPNAVLENLETDDARKVLQIHRDIGMKYSRDHAEHYWTQAEVERETEHLAAQLAIAGRPSGDGRNVK